MDVSQEGTWTTPHKAGDHRVGIMHGEGKRSLGLRPNPRRACQSWSHHRIQYGQEYTEKAWHRTGAVASVLCPARAPNCNAFAERFVRSIKGECLDRMILFGERSLRRAVNEYAVHYHTERNHQGLGNRLLDTTNVAGLPDDPILRRERLGGMLNFYYREAA